ncbi:hypothetical protein BpsS140_00001 [Bacillus phage vB_BpsS-140]|nr:hypothetical protein BpsS140_00001 [Bacillus phage vB_BpsS-140]
MEEDGYMGRISKLPDQFDFRLEESSVLFHAMRRGSVYSISRNEVSMELFYRVEEVERHLSNGNWVMEGRELIVDASITNATIARVSDRMSDYMSIRVTNKSNRILYASRIDADNFLLTYRDTHRAGNQDTITESDLVALIADGTYEIINRGSQHDIIRDKISKELEMSGISTNHYLVERLVKLYTNWGG